MNKLKILKLMFKSNKERRRYTYLFWYALGSKKMPNCLAKRICKKNYKECNPYILKLHTYDGSNQMVHPDLVFWKEKIWVVLTPYPYEIDTYENPCIYNGDSIYSLKEYLNNPLSKPTYKRKKNHISDPWLVIIDDKLYCFFRDTIYKNGNTIQKIFYHFTKDGIEWSRKLFAFETCKDDFISPATFSSQDKLIHFYIKLNGISGGNIRRKVTNATFDLIEEKTANIFNIPDGMHVWHIGVCNKNDFSKDYSANLIGVFTLRGKRDIQKYDLYWAESSDGGLNWIIKDKVYIPPYLESSIMHIYKSAIIPKTGDILLSFKDNEYRWYFAPISGYRDTISLNNDLYIDAYRVFSRVFSNKMSLERFRYKHLENPIGISNSIKVLYENNRAIGVNCFDAVDLLCDGKKYLAVQSCDTAVVQEARGMGVFTKIVSCASKDLFSQGVNILFGFPNNNSYNGFLKMGWKHINTFKTYIFILKPVNVLLGKIGFSYKTKKVILKEKSFLKNNLTLERFRTCPFKKEDLDIINGKSLVIINRTYDYYKWKLDNAGEYLYFLFRNNKRLVCFIAFKVNEKKRVFIADWYLDVSNKMQANYCISVIKKELRKYGNTIVLAGLNEKTQVGKVFIKNGFFDGSKKPFGFHPARLIVKTNNDIDDKIIKGENWHISLIDMDTIIE